MNTPENTPQKRPFPWRCSSCRKKTVELQRFDYAMTFKHDGKTHNFEIKELEAPRCTKCDEFLVTKAVQDQLTSACRQHLGLLSPVEIESELKRLNRTQKQLAEATSIAPETITRWKKGHKFQSHSLNNLIKVYFQFDEVRRFLENDEALSLSAKQTVTPIGNDPVWKTPDGKTAPRSTLTERFRQHGSFWAGIPRILAS